MDTNAARASAVAAWTYDKNRAPSQITQDGRTIDLRPSEFINNTLIATDDESDHVIEADMSYSTFDIDIGTEKRRLQFEASSNPYRVRDRYGDRYQVQVSDHQVTVKGEIDSEQKSFEIY